MIEQNTSTQNLVTLEILESGQKTELNRQGEYILGRNDPSVQNEERTQFGLAQADIDLSPHQAYETGVSRMHARLTLTEDRVFIEDLKSSNGTRINGKDAMGSSAIDLKNGDILTLGRLKIRILITLRGDQKPDIGGLHE